MLRPSPPAPPGRWSPSLYAPRPPRRRPRRPRPPAAAALVIPAAATAAPRPTAQTQLTTPWTAEVSPANALPDYPRPQLTRSRWQNLNGTWQFAEADPRRPAAGRPDLAERVLVPYPVESLLSGRPTARRPHVVPPDVHRPDVVARSGRLILHFQAVDYQTSRLRQRRQVATHTGGYDAFTGDVTERAEGHRPQGGPRRR